MSADEKRIREFAYQIWESEGKPSGQDARHWEMARKLAEAEALAPNKATARKASKPDLHKVDGPASAKPEPKPAASKAKSAPAKPAPKAAGKPASSPAAKPAAKPATPKAKPAAPAAKPASKPAAKKPT